MSGLSRGRREGSTLIELLVALPILALVGSVAIALLLAAHRQARTVDARTGHSREFRHAAIVLGADLRPLSASDVIAWTDTSIEFRAQVALGTMCAPISSRRMIHLAPELAGDPAGLQSSMSIDAGDEIESWFVGGPLQRPTAAPINTVESVSMSASCTGSAVFPMGRAVGVTVRDDNVRPPMEGSPVRISRRARYALYRASDGYWYLGRRSYGSAGWDVIQPVAGPLLSAVRQGLQFTVRDSVGVRLAPGMSSMRVRSVAVSFRSARGSGVGYDSSATEFALRGGMRE